ncbi:MAG: hypothetical protein WC254_02825 [Candidatus Woesearchaeota archaeon]|jgi:hypothetical protein
MIKPTTQTGFPWKKVLYTAIVILLYVPLVLIGVRTFLPDYTDYYTYPLYEDCYMKYAYPVDGNITQEQRDNQLQCQQKQQDDQKAFEEEKRHYDAWKYLTVLGFALITLVAVIFIPLDLPIRIGLFAGAAMTAFVSTIQYFNTESIPAFVVLVIVFCLVLYIIQKEAKYLKEKSI